MLLVRPDFANLFYYYSVFCLLPKSVRTNKNTYLTHSRQREGIGWSRFRTTRFLAVQFFAEAACLGANVITLPDVCRKGLSFADELLRSAAANQLDTICSAGSIFSLRHLTHFSPNFTEGEKVRNLASIFDTTHLRAAFVSKWSKISKI